MRAETRSHVRHLHKGIIIEASEKRLIEIIDRFNRSKTWLHMLCGVIREINLLDNIYR